MIIIQSFLKYIFNHQSFFNYYQVYSLAFLENNNRINIKDFLLFSFLLKRPCINTNHYNFYIVKAKCLYFYD